MISRLEKAWRRLRRAADRSEWLTRILGLKVSDEDHDKSGLVIIQVDGLSHGEFRRALARKELPFLKKLIEREFYDLHPMYSGVPSTTAAVQAELFYGVRQAVPGFSFYDREAGELVRMIEPTTAAKVQRELETACDSPLLSGGSGYANNYTGGAEEPHFCPTAKGWGSGLREAPKRGVVAFILSNLFSFLRMFALAALECVIAVVDLVRGVIAGKSFFKELKFVPTRIAITVLLRELAVIGAKLDIARGLPVIHLNLLGYDEQAHRRGPKSRFAHWTLKGIDDAIERVWKAANRSGRRHYETWVYSDHGQESAVPYSKRHGRTFGEDVAEVFSAHTGEEVPYEVGSPWGAQLHRAGNLGTRIVQRLLPTDIGDTEPGEAELSIAGLGPVAMIYWDRNLGPPERLDLARRLVRDTAAPVVLWRSEDGGVIGWNGERQLRLPEDNEEVLGATHPFRRAAGNDLASLCTHENAGDFIALGTVASAEPALTFALENGAHGGPGAEETSAFALLPRDTDGIPADRETIRVSHLRDAALQARGRTPHHALSAGPTERSLTGTLRLVTYNVHSCIGMDGRLSPQRIARVLARCEPDVVCLQELDMHRPRTESADQAHRIAEVLDMDYHFHPALQIEEERYGDAILTHLPMRLVRAAALPHWKDLPRTEPRGALWVEVTLDDTPVQIINTHLSLRARDRRVQIDALLGPDWLGHSHCRAPVILCGDFNALPGSHVHKRVSRHLLDAQRVLARHKPRPTFSGRFPSARIDHVFVDAKQEVRSVEVPNNELCRLASDHLPLIAEVRIPRSLTGC